MSDQHVSLSYHVRRELLKRIVPRYREASGAQKSLLLDEFVKQTGYARKSAIRLLNHPPGGDHRILHPRVPRYGSEVQQALFLAWKAARYICAKRLIPFLPTLIPNLERHGHLQLSEESRTHLLAMSITTAKRLLRTQRKPAPRGLCTTTAGPLLKHQIPIRTFAQWDDGRPGFLEADLVAHGGGHLEGSSLYTLTLTDIATGWTECLPLLFRSAEAVEAAFQQACRLFPFPILGIDTDNGTEFLNEEIVAYCERKHLTFTRERPGVKNDQAHVEQKNGQIVRQCVGYDRLAGEQAYRQLREVYRAVRLYVNCFQPSMKGHALTDEEGRSVRRVYDQATTPLHRLLRSGVLPQDRQSELLEIADALDPLALLEQVEQLQRALWRCGAGSPSATAGLLRFSLDHCLSGSRPAPTLETAALSDPLSVSHEHLSSTVFLDWPRSTRDPFEEVWELILSLVLAHPERSSGELFQELQRLFPGRYMPSQLGTFYQGVRKIRARLLAMTQDPWPPEVIQSSGVAPLEPESEPQKTALPSDVTSAPAALPLQLPASASALQPRPIAAHEAEGSQVCMLPEMTQITERFGEERYEVLLASPTTPRPGTMTIAEAIQAYVQAQMGGGRRPKTLEWHQTALALFQRYLVDERQLVRLSQVTPGEVRGWMAFLRTQPSATGARRTLHTVETYARSARAFCHWVVHQGYLDQSPFTEVPLPRAEDKTLCPLTPEEWDRLLVACCPPGPNTSSVERPTARNRAILWVLLDTGIRASELCGLRLGDVDRQQKRLRVTTNQNARWVALSERGWEQVLAYLDQHRLQGMAIVGGRAPDDPLFLTETYQSLSPNTLTLLCVRLQERAGMSERPVSPSVLRETFAMRFVQAGGTLEALQDQLGLHTQATLVRYERLWRRSGKHAVGRPGKAINAGVILAL